MADTLAARIEMVGVSKSYPAVRALENVDFRVEPGEIHALMGENGAGKSTLIKIMTGASSCDRGEIRLDGRPVEIASPSRARALGIGAVYQEVNLVPTMSVTKNLTLGRQPRRFGLISWRAARELARERLDEAPPRHRRRATARFLFGGDPTTRGDRASARGRHSPARARRTDGEPRCDRDGAPLPDSPRSQIARDRDRLHHPFHRAGLRDRRPNIRVAQWPAGRRGPDFGASAAEADPDDARA